MRGAPKICILQRAQTRFFRLSVIELNNMVFFRIWYMGMSSNPWGSPSFPSSFLPLTHPLLPHCVGWGVKLYSINQSIKSPSLPISSPPLPCPPFPFPSLRSMARKIQLGGLGECCKLPQRGLGRSPRLPSRSRIFQHFCLTIWQKLILTIFQGSK